MPGSIEEFVASLQDATKFHTVAAVPVFRPHERVLPEYTDPKTRRTYPEVRIKVTKATLAEIAANTNAAGPQPITEGHRVPDPAWPEDKQPRKVGWESNHRVGEYTFDPARGPEPCILADLHYERDLFDQVGPRKYPFRSPDYDFKDKRFVGLALLVRRPFLELGMIPYQGAQSVAAYAHQFGVIPYADDYTAEEEAQYAKMCAYMRKKHPRLAAYMDGEETEEEKGKKKREAQYQADITNLQQKLATEQAERLLAPLAGKVKFNKDRELKALVALPEAERPAHVAYMLESYEKLPVTPPDVKVDTGTGKPALKPGEKPPMTREQMNQVLEYQAGHPHCTYEAAMAAVVAGAAIK